MYSIGYNNIAWRPHDSPYPKMAKSMGRDHQTVFHSSDQLVLLTM